MDKDIAQQILNSLDVNWTEVSKAWCSCEYSEDTYAWHIPPNKHCGICKSSIDNDHYHCGVCSKTSQVG